MTDQVVETPQPLIDTDDPAPSPAPGADDQKPTQPDPPTGADAEKPEAAETPEQQEARKESRRARQARRHAMELGEAKAEARLLRERLERLEQQRSTTPEQDAGPPKRESFESYEDYLEARTDWRADQKVKAQLETFRNEARGREQQSRQTASQADLARQWTERESAYRAKNPQYEERVSAYAESDLGELADQAKRLIVSSDVGPGLLDYLATNSADHDRIAALSPERQLIELGKLEDKVKAPPSKKVSDAPAPVSKLPQGQNAPTGYSDNMSDAEYKAWRKAHGAQWAR